MTGWLDTVASVASTVMSLTMIALAIVLAPAAWSFWRSFRKVRELLDRVYADVTPLTRHASNIADNLDYITTSIRGDIQRVNATIAAANRRLEEAVGLAENRLSDFNALLEVVQEEAEQAFVSTASVVRGVRTGAATLGDRTAGGQDSERHFVGDDDTYDALGVDEGTDDQPEAAPARPRLRPARGRRD